MTGMNWFAVIAAEIEHRIAGLYVLNPPKYSVAFVPHGIIPATWQG